MVGLAGLRSAEDVLGAALLRVRAPGPDGDIAGAGFLVAPDLAVTCAHVVSDALRTPHREPLPEDARVRVDLPLSGGGSAEADVEHWLPYGDDGTGDVAVLRLRAPVRGARPLRMAEATSVWEHAARVAGFPATSPGGVWHMGRLRAGTAEGWVQFSQGDAHGTPIERGFSGAPVWDEELGAVVGMVVRSQLSGPRQSFLIPTGALLAAFPALAPVLRPASPFRGLAAFQEADAEVFFGRDEEAAQVAELVRAHPYVTMVGPSGCGKSSLALAGVVPRLRAAGFAVVVVRPAAGRSLLTTLASELVALLDPELRGAERVAQARDLAPLLADDGLAETVRLVLAETGARRLLIVVDQGEELFADAGGREADTAAPVLFPADPPEELRVLVTLRADFLEAALAHPATGPALSRTVHALAPMTREQLRAVIVRPVETVAGVDYDPGLVDTMLADAGGEPGALPLLGFVLDRLWREQERGQLRFDAYRALGGVQGALGQQAEGIWRECVPEADEDAALRLLTGLVRVRPGGEGGPLRNVLTRAEAGEERWRIARALAARRLLVLGTDSERRETVELAHEALIGAWPRLAERVRADREFLLWRTGLRRDLERWQAAGERTDRLPGADELRAAQPWLAARRADLTPAEVDYLERGQRHRRARRIRRRTGWTAGGLVLLLIVTLGTFLAVQSQAKAESERQSRSRELADLSADLVEQDPGLAAMVAMAAYDTAPTREARNQLLRRYDALRGAAWELSGTQGTIDATAVSGDGRVVLVTTELGRATLFLRGEGEPTRRRQLPVTQNIIFPMVSPDGRRIAYSVAGGSLVWHEIRRNSEDLIGPAHTVAGDEDGAGTKGSLSNPKEIADLSQDGRHAVTVAKGRVALWDLAAGERRRLPGKLPGTPSKVWFGPDAHTVLIQSPAKDSFGLLDDEQARLLAVDTRTGKSRELGKNVARAGVSGDGTTAVLCFRGKRGDAISANFRAVRIADGRKTGSYADTSSLCEDFALDRTGGRIATVFGSTWELADLKSGKKISDTGTGQGGELMVRDLLGTPEAPVAVVTGAGVSGRRLSVGRQEYLNRPALLKDGKQMVVRSGTGDRRRLALLTTDAPPRTEARSPRYTEQGIDEPFAPDDDAYLGAAVRANRAETLVADLASYDTILVHALPSLRPVARITLPMPRANNWDEREGPNYFFLGDDELVTQVDAVVERWDARTGRRLSRLDLRTLGLTTKKVAAFDPKESPPATPFRATPYHQKAHHIQVKVDYEPTFHVIDLRTGREDGKLSYRLGKDAATAFLDASGDHAAVLTRGSLVELWAVRPGGGTSKRLMGPIGPVGEPAGGGYAVDFLGDSSRLFLAEGDSARIYEPGGGRYEDSYDFGAPQNFYAVADGGKALLREDRSTDGVDLIRLDPALWRKELCALLGHREFTATERSGLPGKLPAEGGCGKPASRNG
ncbi:trypsin-like peptidase domain-containing protein [Streptomyces olivaceiscleroticus]|uniref:Novel STAND NTPase 1 domain-containing protein n=1 Tax=Streptomyces olivaceiscleroticus TaxID=68245 RepID=A0ABN1BI08_9ACTN